MRDALRRHWQLVCTPVLIIAVLFARNLPMSDGLRTYITAALVVLAGILLILAVVQGIRLAADIRRDARYFKANRDRMNENLWDALESQGLVSREGRAVRRAQHMRRSGEVDDTEKMG